MSDIKLVFNCGQKNFSFRTEHQVIAKLISLVEVGQVGPAGRMIDPPGEIIHSNTDNGIVVFLISDGFIEKEDGQKEEVTKSIRIDYAYKQKYKFLELLRNAVEEEAPELTLKVEQLPICCGASLPKGEKCCNDNIEHKDGGYICLKKGHKVRLKEPFRSLDTKFALIRFHWISN